jgi:hypothetical protein
MMPDLETIAEPDVLLRPYLLATRVIFSRLTVKLLCTVCGSMLLS